MKKLLRCILSAALIGIVATNAYALPAVQKCQAAKNAAAGAYAACLQKAEGRLATSNSLTKFAAENLKCTSKLEAAWQRANDAAALRGAVCPETPLTVGDFEAVISDHTENIGNALGGAPFQACVQPIVKYQENGVLTNEVHTFAGTEIVKNISGARLFFNGVDITAQTTTFEYSLVPSPNAVLTSCPRVAEVAVTNAHCIGTKEQIATLSFATDHLGNYVVRISSPGAVPFDLTVKADLNPVP